MPESYQLSPATEPASIPTLDGWIESLMNCKLLAQTTNKFPTETDSRPLLDNAFVRRASILDYQKPSASRLRNEIHGSPADNARKASEFVKTNNITLSTSPKCYEGGERGVSPRRYSRLREPTPSCRRDSPSYGDCGCAGRPGREERNRDEGRQYEDGASDAGRDRRLVMKVC